VDGVAVHPELDAMLVRHRAISGAMQSALAD